MTDVLLLRRRYITDIAHELGLVLVRLVAHLGLVRIVPVGVVYVKVLGDTIRLRIIVRLGNGEVIASAAVLVNIDALDLLFLRIQGHLPYFLRLIIHFLLQYFLLLFDCVAVLGWDLVLDVVVVQFLVNRSAHRYFVIEVVLDVDAALDAPPVGVPE
jgi:hypothetical protein